MTNSHVVHRATPLDVTLSDGREFQMDIANPLDFSTGKPALSVFNTDSLGGQIQRAFPETKIDLGDITTARGSEMLLPIWIMLRGKLQTLAFNFKIAR